MNLGLVTSYVVAGILLIAILAMNMSLSSSSTELTLTQMTQEKASGVRETISHDFQKIGYNRSGKTDPILVAGYSDEIQFRANIDNSDDKSVELVTWRLTSNEVSNTKNPNDVVLMRKVKDLNTGAETKTPIKLGVTDFNIKYLNVYGDTVSNHMSTPLSSSQLEDVKQLYVTLELQSSVKTYQQTGDGRYIRSIWKKRFSPPNLESN